MGRENFHTHPYWTIIEVRLELMRDLEQASLHFQEKLKQLLLDMRLQHESLDSLLKMISRIFVNTDDKSRQIFINTMERVAFDVRLDPVYSPAFVTFLSSQQKNWQ